MKSNIQKSRIGAFWGILNVSLLGLRWLELFCCCLQSSAQPPAPSQTEREPPALPQASLCLLSPPLHKVHLRIKHNLKMNTVHYLAKLFKLDYYVVFLQFISNEFYFKTTVLACLLLCNIFNSNMLWFIFQGNIMQFSINKTCTKY